MQYIIAFMLLASAAAFTSSFKAQTRTLNRNQLTMVDISHISNILIASEDIYEYGKVAAPDWVLPVGAFAVILTAAVPAFLAPGEEALAEQRKNEEETKSGFGQGLNSAKKRRDRI